MFSQIAGFLPTPGFDGVVKICERPALPDEGVREYRVRDLANNVGSFSDLCSP